MPWSAASATCGRYSTPATGLPWGSPASSTRRTRPSGHLTSLSISSSSVFPCPGSPPFEGEPDTECDQDRSHKTLQRAARSFAHSALPRAADHVSIEVEPNQEDGFVRGHHQNQSERRIRPADELRQRGGEDRSGFRVQKVVDEALSQGDQISHAAKRLAL